jgi:hypothetical protein
MTSVATLERPRKKAKQKPKAPAKRRELQPVTPHLVCAGAADAIEFYKRAIGCAAATQ